MSGIQPERLGVFGGTFDPPHIGHLILAEEALTQLQLDRVLWLLTPDPPHKTGREISDLNHRIQMLKLALVDECALRAFLRGHSSPSAALCS